MKDFAYVPESVNQAAIPPSPGQPPANTAAIVVIPARLESTRLPRKLLLSRTGQTLLEHTYESVCGNVAGPIFILTDSDEIELVAWRFSGYVLRSKGNCRNGTERAAEASRFFRTAGAFRTVQYIVNVQGDEPELPEGAIAACLQALIQRPRCQMATLATRMPDMAAMADPGVVKVLVDSGGRAIQFSRLPIPGALRHVGVYAYRREFLDWYARTEPGEREVAEGLEQLRGWPTNGGSGGDWVAPAVAVMEGPAGSQESGGFGINTPEDYRRFVERCRARDRFLIAAGTDPLTAT